MATSHALGSALTVLPRFSVETDGFFNAWSTSQGPEAGPACSAPVPFCTVMSVPCVYMDMSLFIET